LGSCARAHTEDNIAALRKAEVAMRRVSDAEVRVGLVELVGFISFGSPWYGASLEVRVMKNL